MRVPRYLLVVAAFIWIAHSASANNRSASWIRADTGIAEPRFVAIAMDPHAVNHLWTATTRAVYESTTGGAPWRERWTIPSGVTIRRIGVNPLDGATVLAATSAGLYGSFDAGAHWTRVFVATTEGANECTQLAFHPWTRGVAVLGTRGGMFESRDGGQTWRAVMAPPAVRDVRSLSVDPQGQDRVYVVSAAGLFVGELDTGRWQRRLTAMAQDDQPRQPLDTDQVEDPPIDPPTNQLVAVAADPATPSTLYVAATKRLGISHDDGSTWQWRLPAGAAARPLAQLLPYAHSPTVLYAATPRGVVRYNPHHQRWTTMTDGLPAVPVNDLAAASGHLWAATDQGLYRFEMPTDAEPLEPPSAQELLAEFVYEPTIAQVREAAIRYAEVHPEKIRHWRQQAALKALLPSVGVGLGHGRARNLDVDEGTFPKFQLIETEDRRADVDLSVKWDLGELIWNQDQTTIDARSRFMVQLREDIVNELIRTYYERRRLQLALLTDPPPDQDALLEKELRIQELTALIDGMTGGYFSQQTIHQAK